MPKEYIERQKLLTHLNERLNYLREENGNYDHYTDGYEEAVDKVEDFLPADVVEVVRCKDCKYLKYGYQCYCPLGMNLTNNEDAYVLVDADNDFCSYGERKEK
jgi:hypothetical protein